MADSGLLDALRAVLGDAGLAAVAAAVTALAALGVALRRRKARRETPTGQPPPRGELAATRHVDMLAGGIGVVGSGALVAILALARHRRRTPTLLAPAFAAMFLSNLCSFLAALPALAAAARPLNVAHGILTVVALPLALGAAWQGLRLARRAG